MNLSYYGKWYILLNPEAIYPFFKHKPHILSGNYSKHWECHVLPDLLLIWIQNDSEESIILVRGGSHSDLF